jgi:lysophospholipase L1-like esterase
MMVPELKSYFASVIMGVATALVACGEDAGSPPSDDGGSGGTQPAGGASGSGNPTGGLGGTGSPGGGANGGSAGSLGTGGASGTSGATGGGGAGTGGVTAGAAGSGLAGQGGIAGSAGASGSASGGAMNGGAGNAGQAGAGGAGRGGASGAGGSGGRGGGAGSSGAAGSGGTSGYRPCPTTGACKIMPFGDSITQGYNVNGGYRAPLFHLALAASRNITFVGSANDYSVPTVDGMTFPRNHEGHGGYTIEGSNGISQFVNTSIPNYQPHIITLMIGTNDINGNVNVSDAPNRLGRLLDSIFTRSADILVVLAQIVPSRTDGTNNAIRTYNSAMPALVSARVSQGRHVVLVDMYGAFTMDTNYKNSLLADNLHPNQAGYTKMADVWFAALDPYLRP